MPKNIKYAIVEALNRTYLWAYTADDASRLEHYTKLLDENSRIIDNDIPETTARRMLNFEKRTFKRWLKTREDVDAINMGEVAGEYS
jgi:hypothetical protein